MWFGFSSMPFGWPVVAYMTLAGLAAGTALWSAGSLLRSPQRFANAAQTGLGVAALCVVAGALFLMTDLEQPARFWMVLAHFNATSTIAWGVRILFLFGLLTGYLWLHLKLSSEEQVKAPSAGLRVLLALAAGLALAMASYPALVLYQAKGKVLWSTLWLPGLFLTSALHTGFVFWAMLLARSPSPSSPPALQQDEVQRINRVDAAGLFLHTVLLALYIVWGSATASTDLLFVKTSLWLWVGCLGVGLILPLFIMLKSSPTRIAPNLLMRSALFLTSSFSLRAFVLLIGQSSIV